jgi:CubicO group peptidase (beta-lactamase class C family)
MNMLILLSFLSVFACSCHLSSAQNHNEDKIDSVSQLVRTYINEKKSAQIYSMSGQAFRKALSSDAFETWCTGNLFPLGTVKECQLEKSAQGVNQYRIVIGSSTLSFLLSLDTLGKIETFLFRPYTDGGTLKKSEVASSNRLVTPLDRQVDIAVRPYMRQQATTGLSIGILRAGKTYFYGYGETAKGNGTKPDEHTIFEIGSISKTFTATLLAIAVNNGKLKLEDPVNRYLPDSIPSLEFEGVPVTLKTLSNHSSGIPIMPTNFYSSDPNNPFKDYAVLDLFSFYKYLHLTRKPGEKYEYSNVAVGTLGVILEKVFGKGYESLITDSICKPLGMSDTEQFIKKNDSVRFAKGYTESGSYISQWDLKALPGAGAIRSTAEDLLKYADGNMGNAPNSLMQAFKLTHMVTFNDGTNKVGLGWHYLKNGEEELLFHNGGTGGFRSYLALNPQKKFAVVILSNTAIGTEGVGNTIMTWLNSNP